MKAPTTEQLEEELKKLYIDPILIVSYKLPHGNTTVGKIKITLSTDLDTHSMFDADKEFILISVYEEGVGIDHLCSGVAPTKDYEYVILFKNVENMEELTTNIMKFVNRKLEIKIF